MEQPCSVVSSIRVASWAVVAWWLGVRRIGELPAVAPPRAADRAALLVPAATSIPDRLRRDETLSTVLARNGFSSADVYEIARALSAIMDVRHLRAGDEFEFHYDISGAASRIQIHRTQLQRIALTRSRLGWQSESEEVELTRRTVSLTSVLDDNLFVSMSRLREGAPLTIAFANVFAWDFDFHTESRNGDLFSVVVEKLYHDGVFVGYGDLRAAIYVSYLSKERVFSAFLYEDPAGNRDYYDPEGKSMRKAFLRAPLDFERISSGFSRSRLHPIEYAIEGRFDVCAGTLYRHFADRGLTYLVPVNPTLLGCLWLTQWERWMRAICRGGAGPPLPLYAGSYS